MKSDKIMRRLRESLDDGRIVTVVRDQFETVMTDGLVIAVSDEWVTLHGLADGVHLDDVVHLRLSDVSRVWFRDDDAYHHRALKALGMPVATFECADDTTVPDLLAHAGEEDRIFAVHFETLEDEPMMIGRLVGLEKRSFVVHYVGRDGV